jgi:hypothetical protein
MSSTQQGRRQADVEERVNELDAGIVAPGSRGCTRFTSCATRWGLSARVFEAGDGVGGTWYWNRYPGAQRFV